MDNKNCKPTVTMVSRIKVVSVMKMCFLCISLFGIVALGIVTSAEVVSAALGSDSSSINEQNQNHHSNRHSGGLNMNSAKAIRSNGGTFPQQEMMMMEPMMDMEESMPQAVMGRSAPRMAPASSHSFQKSAFYDDGINREKLIKQEGGYDPKMGEKILNSGGDNKFDSTQVQPMLIRTGSIQATCKDKDFDNIYQILSNTIINIQGAYIQSSNNNGGYKDQYNRIHGKSINIQAKVPVEKFFELKDNIVKVFPKGDIGSVSDSVSDVTTQYVDAASRAATLQVTYDQLKSLMTMAQTVDSVLKVQRELTQVTQQLEAQEAIMKRLSTSSSLSTLNINVNQEEPPPINPTKEKKQKWSIFTSITRAKKWLRKKIHKSIDVFIFASFASFPIIIIGLTFSFIFKITGFNIYFSKFITNFLKSNPIYEEEEAQRK